MFQGCRFPNYPNFRLEMPICNSGLWNMLVFLSFGILHSILIGINRIVYVAISGITSFLIIILWQPLGDLSIWCLGSSGFNWWFSAIQFVVWLLTHLWIISYSGIWSFIGIGEKKISKLVTEGPYSVMRHPMHFNILLHLIITPFMTIDRLVVLLSIILYLSYAIPSEEWRLRNAYGKDWDVYASQVNCLY